VAGGAHSPKKSGARKAWFWILGAVIVALVIALLVVLLTRDDDDDTPSTTTTTTAPATSTSTTAPATTTTTVPATTTTVVLPVITDDPQTYAEYLFASWQNNNRTDAANVASTEAVDQMFAQAYPAKGPYTFSNCGPAAGSLYCTWNGQNGATIQMTVRTLTGGLPIQVQSVTFAP
jgi:cytoskeletal protein RodZ